MRVFFFFFKDLTTIAGSDDVSIVYCASSFMHNIIDSSVLKNLNVPLMDKQDFFMESLDEWKNSIKDKQDSIRIVVVSRYVNIYACSFE